MNYRALVGNAAIAFAAQGVSLAVSVTMSLLVPKVLGVATYGYWQLFVFYAGYSGFFHLGLNDGVYLVEGGKTRNEIDKKLINSQFRVALALQLVVGLAISLIGVLSPIRVSEASSWWPLHYIRSCLTFLRISGTCSRR